jgi:peroxiredoxin
MIKIKSMLKNKIILALIAILFLGIGGFAYSYFSYSPEYLSEPITQFTLPDQLGNNHSLMEFADKKVVALLSYNISCHTIPKTVKIISALKEKFRNGGIEFLWIDPNIQDSREKILAENLDFSVLIDKEQTVSKNLGLTKAAEVILIDTKNWRPFYRGAVAEMGPNNKGIEKAAYLEEAIEAFLRKKQIDIKETQSLGCAITYLDT